MPQAFKWIDGNPDWICLAEPQGQLLGKVREVRHSFRRPLLAASVVQAGKMLPLPEPYTNLLAAKFAVERFASEQPAQHPEECPCPGCVQKRYEWRLNHITQAAEDELAAIWQAESQQKWTSHSKS